MIQSLHLLAWMKSTEEYSKIARASFFVEEQKRKRERFTEKKAEKRF